ncbi:MAG: sugar-transfer associated ATP-grasp domain-containing protein [Pseudomonadota bacterium]
MTLLWPVVSLHQSITMARAARQGPRHLWARAWAAALLRNVPPWEFADYQFFRPGTPQTGWRFTRETAAALTSMTDRDTAFLIADKARFAEWLDEQGIPAVPTLTIFEDGNSLVTKPPHGSQGQGVQAWIACDGGFRAHAGFGPGKGPTLTIAELEAHIARNNLIAQPLIASPLGQAAIRVVTYREETPAQVFDSLIQVAAPSDFCTHRGPFRRINAASGQVLPPGPGQIRSIFAPDLGEVASEGQSVPGWTQIIDGLLRAHDSLTPPIPLIGWDILIGPDGPLVLEGNTGIGLHLFQLDRLEPANVPMAERLS